MVTGMARAMERTRNLNYLDVNILIISDGGYSRNQLWPLNLIYLTLLLMTTR
jgi:hypothetical protein